MALFTPEELEELRRADADIDENFRETQQEIFTSERRDKKIVQSRKNPQIDKLRAKQREFARKNREKIKAQKKAHRETHREEYLAYQRAYREKNRERRNELQREYERRKRKNNPEEVRAYQRELYRKRKEKQRNESQ